MVKTPLEMTLFSYAHSIIENPLKVGVFIQLNWMVLRLVQDSVLTSEFRVISYQHLDHLSHSCGLSPHG